MEVLVQLTNQCNHISPCHISNSLSVKQAVQPLSSDSRITILCINTTWEQDNKKWGRQHSNETQRPTEDVLSDQLLAAIRTGRGR